MSDFLLTQIFEGLWNEVWEVNKTSLTAEESEGSESVESSNALKLPQLFAN